LSDATKGQLNRRSIREKMESELEKYCPNTISRMANLIAYDFNLAPDTVKYSYLFMFISKGILYGKEDGIYYLDSELMKKESERRKQAFQRFRKEKGKAKANG